MARATQCVARGDAAGAFAVCLLDRDRPIRNLIEGDLVGGRFRFKHT